MNQTEINDITRKQFVRAIELAKTSQKFVEQRQRRIRIAQLEREIAALKKLDRIEEIIGPSILPKPRILPAGCSCAYCNGKG